METVEDMKYIDLHVHSSYSDGTLSPKELVDLALKQNLSYMALTDHDTVDGIQEIIDYKNMAAPSLNIIPGVELSCAFDGPDLHILGLNIDYTKTSLKNKLKECLASRKGRNDKMIENMQRLGFDITKEKILELYGDVSITRAHFARYLVDNGYVKDKNEAFERYLSPDGPVYVGREKFSHKEAIALIKAADGHPVLAHPLLYKCDDLRLNNLLDELKSYGLEGIEAIYSLNTAEDDIYLADLAKKYDLYITGGSDFHGSNKPDINLGVGRGNLRIPEHLVLPIVNH